jgi:hypothetical protein
VLQEYTSSHTIYIIDICQQDINILSDQLIIFLPPDCLLHLHDRFDSLLPYDIVMVLQKNSEDLL